MRLFITGGTGFFGSAIRDYLRNFTEIETLTLTRHRSGEGYLTGDIRTVAFPEESFDAVLHMSLESEGTERLVAWAEKQGIEKMLFTSSGAVYDQHTPYAIGKRWAESVWPGVIARCFSFTGPGIQPHFAISEFIRDAVNGGPIIVKGSAVRSYLYSTDLAEWIMTLLFEGEGIYDVGSEHAIGMHELAQMVRDTLSPGAGIHITGTGGTRYVPDTTRAKALGLEEKIKLPDAIRLTAAYVRSVNCREVSC